MPPSTRPEFEQGDGMSGRAKSTVSACPTYRAYVFTKALGLHANSSRNTCTCCRIVAQEDSRILRAREARDKKRQKQQIDHLATQVKVWEQACRILNPITSDLIENPHELYRPPVHGRAMIRWKIWRRLGFLESVLTKCSRINTTVSQDDAGTRSMMLPRQPNVP